MLVVRIRSWETLSIFISVEGKHSVNCTAKVWMSPSFSYHSEYSPCLFSVAVSLLSAQSITGSDTRSCNCC